MSVAACATISLFMSSVICDEVSLEVNSSFKFVSFPIFPINISFQGPKVSDKVFETSWYKLPLQLQKRFPIILAVNNKQRCLTAYKLFDATRSAYKEAMRTAFSVIVTFRAIMYKT